MFAGVKRVARALGVAVACWSVALPAAASTISLTVSGTTYDVQFTAGSYDSVNGDPATPLTTTPWFGNFSLAQDLAQALQTADAPGGTVVPDTGGWYLFVYTGAPGIQAYVYSGTAAGFNTGSTSQLGAGSDATNFAGDLFYHASVAPTPVPEIDGNALFKALFVLFTLGVWLDLRRRRTS